MTNKNLILEIPFINYRNNLRKKFQINILNIKEISSKIFFSNFKQNIQNFYMTDIISKNSKIMSECTLFLKNKSNFH